MTYDGLDRLKTVFDAPMFGTTGATYAYDVLDNLTRVTIGGTRHRDHDYYYEPGTWRLANVIDHDTQASVVGLDYDVQGNLTVRNDTAYVFDYGNRLRSVQENASGSLSKYVYDGNGRRVRDDVDGTLKHSVYTQAGQIVFTNEQRYDLKHWYFYLGGSLVAVRELDKGTGVVTMQYQHTDALGTPMVVTGANRNVLERSEYEPYGQVINRPVKDGPGFTGHVMDAATELAYMQQRYYDPMIGRFLSVDPVTALSNPVAMFNRYKYANNNPYRFTDPDGRTCQTVDGKINCVVDSYIDKKGNEINRADMTKAQLKSVRGFENSYTAAVAKLMANPNKAVTISMPGKQASTTAGEVGKALIGRNVVANSPLAGGGMATGGNTTYVGSMGLSGEGSLTGVTVSGADAMRQVEITHEGMHGDGTDVSSALKEGMEQGPWNEAHQTPFNQAAMELLSPTP